MYGPEAYSPNGTLWWRLEWAPGKKKQRFGDEQKIAAYLACHVGANDTFTMRTLRAALGEHALPNDKEHLNRRLRTLRRRDGWVIKSQRDDGSLSHDQYRVAKVGWHPGSGVARPVDDKPSRAVQRRVFARDGSKCVVCGVAAGEEHFEDSAKTARLTLGHRIPGTRLSRQATEDDLQTECSQCNETVRDELPDPSSLTELMPSIKNLGRADKVELLKRLKENRRTRTRLDDAHDAARRLSASEKDTLIAELRLMTMRPEGGSTSSSS